MDLYTFLVLSHVIGTVLGVGGATFAEVLIVRALRDGQVSIEESDLMKATYVVLRLGLFILFVSGFSFLLYYRLNGFESALYSPKLWAKLSIIVVLVVNAVLLHIHRIPLLLGSAISSVSWYAALVLGVWRGLDVGYFKILLVYLVFVGIAYVVLGQIHKKFIPPKKA